MDSSRWVFHKKALTLILALIAISPIFGVLLADIVGYHEPLDVAAEALNLPDLTELINWTPFLDYTIPGLPAEVGYIIAGFIGVLIIFGLGVLLSRMVRRT
ncbi:MAG: PDGLE domain-containing protein [Candidatus Bathyarchaeia archaeon]